MIILPQGIYCYKRLTMGINNSPDILQHKMNDLFHEFHFILSYIDEVLILTIGRLTDHVHKLELTLNKLKSSWIKCNTGKYFFGQNDMEHLELLVARDVIKHIDKKYKQ